MRPPSPTWECDYRHDRRKHRHRCRCCSKIINDGERVLMTRQRGGSIAIHVTPCADKPFNVGANTDNVAGWIWRDAMEAWGTTRLRRLGWTQIPEHPMSQPGAVKERAA